MAVDVETQRSETEEQHHRSRLYLAAPFFNEYQRDVLVQVRAALQGWQFFDPEQASKDIWKGRPPEEASSDDRRAVLQQNVRGIETASLVVAWLRGTGGPFTDTGVVWELGYSWCTAVPVLGFCDNIEEVDSLNLMMAETLAGLCKLRDLRYAVELWENEGTAALHHRFPPNPARIV